MEEDDNVRIAKEIRGLASMSTMTPFQYKFHEAGQMQCSIDRTFAVPFGNLEYESPVFTMHGAIKLKDWYFSLEETPLQDGYIFCVFFGKEHFTFGKMKGKDLNEAKNNFLTTCLLDMCPFIYKDEVLALEKKHGSDSYFNWEKVMTGPTLLKLAAGIFDRDEETLKINKLLGAGVL